jgi:adenosyl cobinamide kinase/adenosyl cobinamide phosphate guanylyltransferase
MLKNGLNKFVTDIMQMFVKDVLDLFLEAFLSVKPGTLQKEKRDAMAVLLADCGLKRGDAVPEVVQESPDVYTVKMPVGMTLQEFRNRSGAISQAIGDDVDVSFCLVGQSKLKMTIIRGKLKDFYVFEQVKFKNSAEFLIGPGKFGIVSVDFTKHPNMLVAGGTGSGKSTFMVQLIINTILTNPDVILHLIDLKSGIEFHTFKNVLSVESYADDIGPAADIIYKLDALMESRQKTLAGSGVVKLSDYNDRYPLRQMKYHLVIVDEFANLREEKGIKAIFDKVLRMGRNVGIFFVLATQRPTVDTIPGNFSANIHCRIAFKTTLERESEIILGYGNQEAAHISVPGRGIFQAVEQVEVQPMFIKNDDRVILPMLTGHLGRERIAEKIDTSGVLKC